MKTTYLNFFSKQCSLSVFGRGVRQLRPCETGNFPLKPYRNDYGNWRLYVVDSSLCFGVHSFVGKNQNKSTVVPLEIRKNRMIQNSFKMWIRALRNWKFSVKALSKQLLIETITEIKIICPLEIWKTGWFKTHLKCEKMSCQLSFIYSFKTHFI